MDVFEKILEHGANRFDELIESFSDAEIEEMNTEYSKDDFVNEFGYRFMVVRDYLKQCLITDLECNEKIANIRELFEIYASIERYGARL